MLTYHSSIIQLIQYILTQGSSYIEMIDSGNAYDKIFRNYHQFNYKGEKVYRNKTRIKQYYRFTEQAWNKGGLSNQLYYEHLIPIKLMKTELSELTAISTDSIQAGFDKNEIVVITRD